MSTQQSADQDNWNKLLDDAFGAEQPSEPTEEPAAQAEIPTEEPVTCPESPVTVTPTPRKRPLWPFFAVAAVILALIAVLLLLPRQDTGMTELQLCKDALAQWQSYETYHITEECKSLDSMSLRPYTAQHFRNGEDIIQLTYSSYYSSGLSSSSTLSITRGYMLKDGQTYEYVPVVFGDLIDSDGVTFPWEPVVLYGEGLTYPWPITFQWDDEKILSHNTRYYESSAVESVMVTIKENQSKSDNSPFNVVFRFSETGKLTALSMQQIATTNHDFTGIYISTFYLEDTDPEQIKEKFNINVTATSTG